MLVFGAVDFTAALVKVAKVLGYRVTVCDAREVFATRARFPQADEVVVDWPDRLLGRVGSTLTPRDAVCVLTHDAKFDVPAVVAALATDVGYIGAMGSRRTHADRVGRLREAGVGDAGLARVHAPIGLDLGARTPEETAVSICAEIIAHRTGRAEAQAAARHRRADPRGGRDGVTTAAVVLAAGGGSRFTASGGEGHKLLAPYLGRAVVEWAIEAATAAGLDATYVVRGATDLPVPPLAHGAVTFVRNDRWREGIATSLQAGVARARQDGHAAVVIGLGDQPLVQTDAWQRVAAAGRTPISVATYEGVRGNPVRLSSMAWPLLPADGDEGARLVMRRRPDLVVEVPCPGRSADIDTVEDLATWTDPGGSSWS